MMEKKTKKNIFLMIQGLVLMILGVTCILVFWPQVVEVFKGTVGILLALVGLAVLFFVKE